ncbi:HGGxSTG domain-containing protein [Ruegeria meonggei]
MFGPKRRCKFHGGRSTGPKTDAGRKAISKAQKRRWAAYRKQ